jgi:hypothetical protein
MNRQRLLGANWTLLVDRLANHVQDASECFRSDRHGDRLAGIRHFGVSNHAFGGIHSDGTYRVFAEMLSDLQNQRPSVYIRVQRVHDGWKVAIEMHVHHSA